MSNKVSFSFCLGALYKEVTRSSIQNETKPKTSKIKETTNKTKLNQTPNTNEHKRRRKGWKTENEGVKSQSSHYQSTVGGTGANTYVIWRGLLLEPLGTGKLRLIGSGLAFTVIPWYYGEKRSQLLSRVDTGSVLFHLTRRQNPHTVLRLGEPVFTIEGVLPK